MAAHAHLERPVGDPSRGEGRDPANQLYDEACALLAAAQGLRAAARPQRSAPAIAASLGCVEASLEALATAVKVMRLAAVGPNVNPVPDGRPTGREALQVRASFDWLARDLTACRSSCATARELVGPALANR